MNYIRGLLVNFLIPAGPLLLSFEIIGKSLSLYFVGTFQTGENNNTMQQDGLEKLYKKTLSFGLEEIERIDFQKYLFFYG